MLPENLMQRCIDLALRGKGSVAPNPMVGAVLVHQDTIIGEGWHKAYGLAHAEVDCFEQVPPELRHLIPESTLYVNLEPCAHYGKTPPCAHRIVKEGVKKVVIANQDPFEAVNGRGITILQEAGIEVETGLLADAGAWLNRAFFTFHKEHRPYVVLKWAQSADGFLAPATPSRLQISGPISSRWVHKWRTEHAAILVGHNTALIDDPQLTARHWPGKQPLRIVIDRSASLPRTAAIFQHPSPIWIVNEHKTEQEGNVHWWQLPMGSALWPALMELLYNQGIQSIIIEGGAQVLQQCIDQGFWDEARVFTGATHLQQGLAAPKLVSAHLATIMQLHQDSMSLYLRQNSGYSFDDFFNL